MCLFKRIVPLLFTEMLHDWGELDRDAPKTEETTRRLAVCNMDWDNIKALDLFLLFDGLDKRTSAGGIIQAVKVCSDFTLSFLLFKRIVNLSRCNVSIISVYS